MTITYNGSTAGSTSSNPPNELAAAVGGQIANSPGLTGARLWFYTSTNAYTDMFATSNAIADGYDLGMRAGDFVIGVQATAGSTTPFHWTGVVAYSAAGVGACLSSGALSSTSA